MSRDDFDDPAAFNRQARAEEADADLRESTWCGSCDQLMSDHEGTWADAVCPDVCAGCGEVIQPEDGPVFRDPIQEAMAPARFLEAFHDPKGWDCYVETNANGEPNDERRTPGSRFCVDQQRPPRQRETGGCRTSRLVVRLHQGLPAVPGPAPPHTALPANDLSTPGRR